MAKKTKKSTKSKKPDIKTRAKKVGAKVATTGRTVGHKVAQTGKTVGGAVVMGVSAAKEKSVTAFGALRGKMGRKGKDEEE